MSWGSDKTQRTDKPHTPKLKPYREAGVPMDAEYYWQQQCGILERTVTLLKVAGWLALFAGMLLGSFLSGTFKIR